MQNMIKEKVVDINDIYWMNQFLMKYQLRWREIAEIKAYYCPTCRYTLKGTTVYIGDGITNLKVQL